MAEMVERPNAMWLLIKDWCYISFVAVQVVIMALLGLVGDIMAEE